MRPRERYAVTGPDEFGDTELLALILGTGSSGRPARTVARSLVDRFDGLSGLARVPVGALCRVEGVGLAQAVRLHAALQAGRRSLSVPERQHEPIDGPASAWQLFGPRLSGLDHEELHAAYLDRRHRLLSLRLVSRGSDSHTIVDPRQVFAAALLCGASAVVVAHNHPSGDAAPSRQDREVTEVLAAAGHLLGIQLLDHLVVGAGSYTSLAERGWVREGGRRAGWTACP